MGLAALTPYLQQVVGVPVSLSCDSGGGQKGRAVGGGSIHKLPPALPGRNVALSLLGARRSTAGTVASATYSTCSGGRWWAWFPRVGPWQWPFVCVPKQACTPHGLPHLLVGGARFAHVVLQECFLGPFRVL